MLMQKIPKIDIFNTWPFQNFAPQYIYIALLFFCFFLSCQGFLLIRSLPLTSQSSVFIFTLTSFKFISFTSANCCSLSRSLWILSFLSEAYEINGIQPVSQCTQGSKCVPSSAINAKKWYLVLMAEKVKNLPAKRETWVRSLG